MATSYLIHPHPSPFQHPKNTYCQVCPIYEFIHRLTLICKCHLQPTLSIKPQIPVVSQFESQTAPISSSSINACLRETWHIAYVCTGTVTQVNGLQSNKKSYFKLGGSFPSYSIMPNQHKKLSYIGLEGINCTENCNGCKKN